jgi:hypothetical protein
MLAAILGWTAVLWIVGLLVAIGGIVISVHPGSIEFLIAKGCLTLAVLIFAVRAGATLISSPEPFLTRALLVSFAFASIGFAWVEGWRWLSSRHTVSAAARAVPSPSATPAPSSATTSQPQDSASSFAKIKDTTKALLDSNVANAPGRFVEAENVEELIVQGNVVSPHPVEEVIEVRERSPSQRRETKKRSIVLSNDILTFLNTRESGRPGLAGSDQDMQYTRETVGTYDKRFSVKVAATRRELAELGIRSRQLEPAFSI